MTNNREQRRDGAKAAAAMQRLMAKPDCVAAIEYLCSVAAVYGPFEIHVRGKRVRIIARLLSD